MLISPSLSTTASVQSSSCGALSGVRFFLINSTAFGNLLLQHAKKLLMELHGINTYKYALFSMIHSMLLSNYIVVGN